MVDRIFFYGILVILLVFACKKEEFDNTAKEDMPVKIVFPEETIIKDFYPKSFGNQFAFPYFTFNYPLETAISNLQDTLIRVNIDTLLVYNGDSSIQVDGVTFLSNSKDTLFFQSLNIYPINTILQFNLKLNFQFFNGQEWVNSASLPYKEYKYQYRVSDSLVWNNKIKPENESLISTFSLFEIESYFILSIDKSISRRGKSSFIKTR